MSPDSEGEWLRPRRWVTLAVLVGGALAIVAACFRFPGRWADPYDWRYFESMEEAYRLTAAGFHQMPLWNPYICGGEVALANPQSTIAAPTFLLSLLLGTPLGLKLALCVYYLCAFHGAYLLARDAGCSWAASLVAGAAFGGCGWFAMHLSSGHINFAGAALYPYLLTFFRRSFSRRWEWAIAASAIVVWMAGLGGTYTAPMGAVLLGVVAVTETAQRRSYKPLAFAALVGGLALALGAWRFLPVLEFATHHPRHVSERDANTLLDLGRAFFAWRQSLAPVDGHVYWWHEYCCHLGYLGFVLALVGGLRGARPRDAVPSLVMIAWTLLDLLPSRGHVHRYIGYDDAYWIGWTIAVVWGTRRSTPRARAMLPVIVVSLGIALGNAWPHGPWWLLRRLPLYGDLRVPSRYLVVTAVGLAAWAALGVDELCAWWTSRGRDAGRLAALLIAIVTVEAVAFSAPTFFDVFTVIQDPSRAQPAFAQVTGDRRWMFSSVLEGHGVIECDEEAPLQRAEALDLGVVEQIRLVDPAAGNAQVIRWTPNHLELRVSLARPTELMINENWNEHWRASTGEVRALAGRLSVALPAGASDVVLDYRPKSFVVGAWVSVLAALAALVALARALRRPRV